MNSIRSFILTGTLSVLILFNFIAAIQGYRSSMAEAEMLFDNHLLEHSQLMTLLDFSSLDKPVMTGSNMVLQVWQNDKLIKSSLDAPETLIGDGSPGFDFANFNSYRWRTFTRSVRSDYLIIVAERTDLRFVLAENVILESLLPSLLGIPVVGFIVWIIISRGLLPLKNLSQLLQVKKANDFKSVTLGHVPNELIQVIDSINSYVQRLERVLEREKRFSADAAHELRTPISALKIQLHNIATEAGYESENFLQLKSGVNRLQHLIEQLLVLYRLTPEQFQNTCHVIELSQICQDTIAAFYPVIEKKSQSLELEEMEIDSEKKKLEILGDTFALETLLTNLLSNASLYTPPGGQLKVIIDADQKYVYITVEDNGPGIAESERELIFQRFYRSKSNAVITSESATNGGGLGLTIVHHLAQLHQATVTVSESSLGQGAAFKLRFPRLCS